MAPPKGGGMRALAAMPGAAKPCEDGCSHVPNKGEQMARYYDFYSNVARGKRKKTDADDKIPCFLEPELTGKTFRRNWARLIQKIYHVDPLICPKCRGKMRIISWIEDEVVIKKILKHLGLWLPKRSPPPKANAPPKAVLIDYLDSQTPSAEDYLIDPDYPTDSWLN
jgi:hypothetical protein